MIDLKNVKDALLDSHVPIYIEVFGCTDLKYSSLGLT